ncbi:MULTISPECIES: hypothetical protein [Streptomyces violaceusniger group]|uniref:Small CPxCG-related zinc finger protein n=2 Tax=Streptomyces violaceusniger group TaxID=2839105 RepID=A0ABD5JDY8_9ACTN|nr:hypothetical protein [Streptomyces violaceusniger]KUL48690.1 hypothetical protein ADL28_28440 [Streptomyces violaceusniger]MEE4586270.1 hypothetical protein [Streptomyces sp. DSM 41602]
MSGTARPGDPDRETANRETANGETVNRETVNRRTADPAPAEPEGGESACWLDRVCADCGAIQDTAPFARCARCGAPRE